jgi:hypothetical protein
MNSRDPRKAPRFVSINTCGTNHYNHVFALDMNGRVWELEYFTHTMTGGGTKTVRRWICHEEAHNG